jgi:hypothetical protein
MGTEMPVTVVACDGCEKELNVLTPYLSVLVRPKRDVIVSEEVASSDPNEVSDNVVYLGSKTGRAVLLSFHDFNCLDKWVNPRKGLPAKLEHHAEKEIYVPEDNPDDAEIAKRAADAEKAAAAAEKATKAGEN